IKDFSAVQTGAFKSTSGNAGDIRIETDHLLLEGLGRLVSSSSGSGKAVPTHELAVLPAFPFVVFASSPFLPFLTGF
ncbi:MAG: hypothetical protein GY862_25105, partial [Gammaproteobacteria bacterium]|nr:hypothetical protein [Gammaproteobacteria bacterium]